MIATESYGSKTRNQATRGYERATGYRDQAAFARRRGEGAWLPVDGVLEVGQEVLVVTPHETWLDLSAKAAKVELA